MTWEQITVACPCCNQSVAVVRAFVHIRHLCPRCGGYFTLTSPDPAGLPIPAPAATPEELSLKASGGWRAFRGLR